MTKKEAKARKEAYAKALSEGRVVRYNDGMTFQSFPTVEEAKAFLEQCHAADMEAKRLIVTAGAL